MSTNKEKLDKATTILQAAEKLFSKYGYKKVSVDEIVKTTNIAKGTFYLYFQHKDDLYNKIINEYFEKKMKYTQTALGDIQKGEKEKLLEIMIGNLFFLINTPILREIFLQNSNYISETINRDVLKNKNMKIIKSIVKTLAIRKDFDTTKHMHEEEEFAFLPIILSTYKQKTPEMFWKCTENLLKIWIDGLTSNYEWKNKPTASIINDLGKELGI
ncbi:TetR/AcrR family transcriptional regulator [Patescibacteria group bacterium]|nr:TetR/AcrR family transcriptional regulator [Patescibacteria group bacterium]